MNKATFEQLRKTGKNFSLTPNGELSFEELFCSIINDGDNPYVMPIDDRTFVIITYFVKKVFLPIRTAWGKPLTISSGIRSFSSYKRLIANGYRPAKTSDHFFGQDIEGYTSAAGALDIVPKTGKTEQFFEWLVKHYDRKANQLVFENVRVDVGQILIESGKVSKWVHLSGDRVKVCKSKDYMIRLGISENNGKSFTKV